MARYIGSSRTPFEPSGAPGGCRESRIFRLLGRAPQPAARLKSEIFGRTPAARAVCDLRSGEGMPEGPLQARAPAGLRPAVAFNSAITIFPSAHS